MATVNKINSQYSVLHSYLVEFFQSEHDKIFIKETPPHSLSIRLLYEISSVVWSLYYICNSHFVSHEDLTLFMHLLMIQYILLKSAEIIFM